jgi:hypothetical protein
MFSNVDYDCIFVNPNGHIFGAEGYQTLLNKPKRHINVRRQLPLGNSLYQLQAENNVALCD